MMRLIYGQGPESCLSEYLGELYNRSDLIIWIATRVLLRMVVVLFFVDVLQVFVNLARVQRLVGNDSEWRWLPQVGRYPGRPRPTGGQEQSHQTVNPLIADGDSRRSEEH